jgi:hypothetical protein
MIRVSTATVYHGGGRRWFSLKAAANAEAGAKIKARCDCDDGLISEMDRACGYYSACCQYHDGSDFAIKVRRRLARVYINAYRKSQ